MVNGTTACAPARSLSQPELFKLLLLESLRVRSVVWRGNPATASRSANGEGLRRSGWPHRRVDPAGV